MGRSEIPTVARGQTFVVGFGVNPQLRARRELASRTENVQGGNRELGFKYRLVLENYKEQPAEVRLFDRLPYSDRPNDVRVKLGELHDPLSKDKFYVRTEQPKGILRWEIDVKAGATGENVRIVNYGFTLDFDRNLSLYIPGTSPLEATPGAGGMGGAGFRPGEDAAGVRDGAAGQGRAFEGRPQAHTTATDCGLDFGAADASAGRQASSAPPPSKASVEGSGTGATIS